MRNAPLRVLVMVALTLVFAGAVDEAWARARGGGSRGSRSYSAPARPAPMSPASPASPSRSLTNPTPAPAPARGGMFGGLMGMVGGFMLGGLLGSLLFGGLGGLGSGLGFGLMDLLLIGGGLFLLFRLMKSRRQPQPAYAGGAAYAGGGPATAEAPAGGGVTMEVPASPADDLERGFTHIRQMDPGFDAARLAADAAEAFRAVQTAVTAGDMRQLRPKLTSEMFERLQQQCDELRRSRRTNHVERIQIERAEATEAWQERGNDFVTVVLAGSLIDYTLDSTGTVVDGSRTPQRFEEYWTFTRAVGPNAWTLTAIQAA
ncbi:MAG TPA: Tim44-like domain-containing protein [Methylomirabilota bacterium]|nr:Tim44-like domain-containing protein [Methylomirabilota bacterium]